MAPSICSRRGCRRDRHAVRSPRSCGRRSGAASRPRPRPDWRSWPSSRGRDRRGRSRRSGRTPPGRRPRSRRGSASTGTSIESSMPGSSSRKTRSNQCTLDPGEMLDEAEEVRSGRHAGCALLFVGQAVQRANHRVTILVEVVQEHIAFGAHEVLTVSSPMSPTLGVRRGWQSARFERWRARMNCEAADVPRRARRPANRLLAVVLVEGISDQLALEALARRRGRDLEAEGIRIVSMGGATTIGRFLERFGPHGSDVDWRACATPTRSAPSSAVSGGPVSAPTSPAPTWRRWVSTCATPTSRTN